MRHIIHVHQANMRQGKPAIIDRTYIRSTHHTNLAVLCECGKVAATIVQSEQQDACGAHIWIEATKTNGNGYSSEQTMSSIKI